MVLNWWIGFANIGYLFYVVFVCLDVCTFFFVWKFIPEVTLSVVIPRDGTSLTLNR